MRLALIFILLVRITLVDKAWAQADYQLSSLDARGSLQLRDIKWLEDPKGQLNLDLVQLRQDFKSSRGKVPAFGWTGSAYWFMLTLHNDQSTMQDVVLEIQDALLDNIQLFLIDATGQTKQRFVLGDKFPFHDRIIDHTNFLIPLKIEPEKIYQVYIRLETTSSLQLPLTLWKETTYYEDREISNSVQALYYGAMLVMILYNFFIFLSVRSLNYLYYAGFVGCFVITVASIKGLAYQYLWPETPWMTEIAATLFGPLTCAFGTAFAKRFLKIEADHPWLSRILNATLGYYLMVASLSFILPYRTTISLAAVGAIVWAVTLFCSGWLRYFQGFTEARFYVAAWVSVLLGVITYMLKQFGILPSNLFTNNMIYIGSLLEVVLLSFALADRLNTMRKTIQGTNEQLKFLNDNLEHKVRETTNDIRSILTHMPEGVFQITSRQDQLSIDSEYSQILAVMCGQANLQNCNPISSIFAKTSLAKDTISALGHIFETSFDEDLLQWQINEHLLPAEFSMEYGGGTKFIEATYSPVLDGEVIKKILISLKDVTEVRKLREHSIQTSKASKKILELASMDSRKSTEFISMASELIQISSQLSDKGIPGLDDIASIYRNIHTIKGLARGYAMEEVVALAHETENRLQALKERSDPQLHASLGEALATARDSLREYAQINNELLGRESSHRYIKVGKELMGEIRRDIRSGLEDRAQLDKVFRKIANQLLFLDQDNLAGLLHDEFKMLADLASKLGKVPPRIQIDNDIYTFQEQTKLALRQSFVHILRNCVDHGLEPPEDRETLGKAPQGTVHIQIVRSEQENHIDVQDDGRGLNIQRIQDKALKSGLLQADAKPSLLEIGNIIFHSGFSSASEVTTVSGRGVGMDAVKAFLQDCGCTIELRILSERDERGYCRFALRIHVPEREWVDLQLGLSLAS